MGKKSASGQHLSGLRAIFNQRYQIASQDL